ncbi:hypothetical protein [Oceanispirochaeta crateris]|uniref:hypothetical protein n=1 Tax=Oceanispirochaeta crateris TaxID=2518645 RepID=UPI001AEF7511|nr:hypothetical protein [Oceanispirochaeta crateris]
MRFPDRVLPFFYGFLAAIPIVLLQWALDVYFPLQWNPLGIFMYCFFNKEGFIIYPLLLLLFFTFKKKSYNGIPLRELTAWFCGYYFMFSLSESLILDGAMTPFGAVLNPLIRLFTLMILSTLLVRALHEAISKKKYLYTSLYFLAPVVLNFLPVFHLINNSILFYLMFFLIGILSVVLYLLESRGKIS